MTQPISSVRQTSVRVRELPLLADIGINPDEVGRRQPLIITIEVQIASQRIAAIGETVDYRRIVQAAEDLALLHIPLIETFAERLADRCLAFNGVTNVDITIDKPFAITRGVAGIRHCAIASDAGCMTPT